MACLLGGLSRGEGAEVWVHSMREGLQQVPGAGWHHVRVGGAGLLMGPERTSLGAGSQRVLVARMATYWSLYLGTLSFLCQCEVLGCFGSSDGVWGAHTALQLVGDGLSWSAKALRCFGSP